MATHPITLHEDEQSKVVQLSGEYRPASFYENINELKVIFTAGGIELYRIQDPEENKKFGMSAAEADAFVVAWETFQAEQQLKKMAEAQRLQDMIDSAQRMLAEFPIFIEKHPETDTQNSYWTIQSPELESIKYTAYSADQLFDHAKLAIKHYERHKREQAIHDEVKALKEVCPAIKIKGDPKRPPWQVKALDANAIEIFTALAHSPEQLLERVKQAKAKYEQWQAEQDQLIQQNG